MTQTAVTEEIQATSPSDELVSLRKRLHDDMDRERIHTALEYVGFASQMLLDYRHHRGTDRGIEIMNAADVALTHAHDYVNAVLKELR